MKASLTWSSNIPSRPSSLRPIGAVEFFPLFTGRRLLLRGLGVGLGVVFFLPPSVLDCLKTLGLFEGILEFLRDFKLNGLFGLFLDGDTVFISSW